VNRGGFRRPGWTQIAGFSVEKIAVGLSVGLPVCLSVGLPVCLSVGLPVRLAIQQAVSLDVGLEQALVALLALRVVPHSMTLDVFALSLVVPEPVFLRHFVPPFAGRTCGYSTH
jgi:hypothetical protein